MVAILHITPRRARLLGGFPRCVAACARLRWRVREEARSGPSGTPCSGSGTGVAARRAGGGHQGTQRGGAWGLSAWAKCWNHPGCCSFS